MKQSILLAAIVIAPFALKAQPTIYKAMDFSAGASIKFQNCQGIAAGPAGASQNWNFSGLKTISNDTTRMTFITAPTNNSYGANIIIKTSDSSYMYYNKTATSTYLAAIVDSTVEAKGMALNYSKNTMLQVQRPLTYNLALTDNFSDEFEVMGSKVKGGGTFTLKADGYGTLTLPSGTFNNVLRVRTEQVQTDTLPAPISQTFTSKTISYIWYDNAHIAPIFRIDSTIIDGSADATASYFLKETYATGVADTKMNNLQINGSLSNGTLLLKGDLEQNKKYAVELYNLSGQQLFQSYFTATGNMQKVDVNMDMPAGMYIVKLQEAEVADFTTLKLLKP